MTLDERLAANGYLGPVRALADAAWGRHALLVMARKSRARTLLNDLAGRGPSDPAGELGISLDLEASTELIRALAAAGVERLVRPDVDPDEDHVHIPRPGWETR